MHTLYSTLHDKALALTSGTHLGQWAAKTLLLVLTLLATAWLPAIGIATLYRTILGDAPFTTIYGAIVLAGTTLGAIVLARQALGAARDTPAH